MVFSKKVQRSLLVAGVAVVVYTVVGFFVLPPIVKTQLERRLSAALGRTVTVEKVRLNPYALSVSLEGFAIQGRDGAAPFVAWRRLYVDFNAVASLAGEWEIGEIVLDDLSARVAVNPDGSLNFSDILGKLLTPPASPVAAPTAPAAKPSRPVRIGRLAVSGARVDFTDRSRSQPFATTIGPVTFVLSDFHTSGRRGAPYHFEAVTETGERLAWSGTLQAAPLRSTGELAMENIHLPKYAPYYASQLAADIAAGTLTVRGHYELNLAENQRVVKLIGGAVQLRGLKLLERATATPAFALAALDVTGVQADALTLQARIDTIALSGGQVSVRREKDGTVNLLALVPAPAAASPAAPAAAAPAKRPDLSVGRIALSDFRVDLLDHAAPREVRLALTGLQFSLTNVTLADGATMPLQLAFDWAPHGTVKLAGEVGLFPVKATLKAEVAGLTVMPLSPYLESFANVHITEGALTTTLALGLDLAGSVPAATVAGDLRIEHFGLVDGTRDEELAGFRTLALKGLRASTAPALSVTLDEVDLTGSYARAVIGSDHVLNFAAIMAGQTPAPAGRPAASAPTPVPAAVPQIEIGKIVFEDGDYRFTDRSLEPNVHLAIEHFHGTIAGLSATHPGRGDVDLKAMVDGAGPIAITGRLDPLGARKSLDLTLDFKNVDLTPLSPYSGKYAGYELARGKLALDVKLRVDDQRIDATSVITLHQFTFGAAVPSPDATKLPVRLGVALLKDLDGKIVIDVPVQGRIDDPELRIGRVVWRVVGNLLTKAAVSPFSLLGAAFGGGEELSYQEFAPGATELRPKAQQKLETLTRALTNRPGLSLVIAGGYDAAADTYALKRLKLAEQVRLAVWRQRRATDPNIEPPASLTISPEENAAMIKQLFDAKFPPGTQFGTPLPAAPAIVAPPPAKPGFFRRLTAVITLRAQRERYRAKKENARRAAEHGQAVAAAKAAGLSQEEMSGRLAEAIEIGADDLQLLAQARAQRVRDYFSGVGGIAPERLFLTTKSANGSQGPRVLLTLQ